MTDVLRDYSASSVSSSPPFLVCLTVKMTLQSSICQ